MKCFATFATVVVSCLFVTSSAVATDLLVPSQYSTIQAAINAAVDGDTVIVAPGIYNETMGVSGKSITIRSSDGPITTKIDRNNATGDVFTVTSTPAAGVTIDGFTIIRCAATAIVASGSSNVTLSNIRVISGQRGARATGGSHLTMTDCQVAGLGGVDGCGVNVEMAGSTLSAARCAFGGCTSIAVFLGPETNGTLVSCDFTTNTATSIRAEAGSAATVTDCEFSNCSGAHGGVAYGDACALSFSGCEFVNISVVGYGGVAYLTNGILVVSNCHATNIRSEYGGAFVWTDSTSIDIDGLVFENSTTRLEFGSFGGVIGSSAGSLTVRHSLFRNILITSGTYYAGGSAGGACVAASWGTAPVFLEHLVFENCSWATGAYGSDVSFFGRLVHVTGPRQAVFESVSALGGIYQFLTGWSSGGRWWGAVAVGDGVTASFSNCSFTSQFSHHGAVYSSAVKPLSFVNCDFIDCSSGGIKDAGGDHALLIDDCRFLNCTAQGGITVTSPTTDLRVSDSRFINNSRGTASQGSAISCPAPYSLFASFFSGNTSFALYAPAPAYIVMGDCAFCGPRPSEVFGAVIDKGNNSYSVDCTLDCDADGDPDEHEIAAGHDTDCNGNGVPDSCDTDSGGADCNGNGIPDSCDIAGGAPDCDVDGVPDSCESDCDSDGVPDSCAIAGGASDCNANGVPDTCEADCDGDGVLDVCEIASGASDCDANGVPDSCQIAASPMLDFNNDAVIDTCQPSMQFAGLQLEVVPIVGRGTDDTFPVGAVCYRLYAMTTNADTRAFAVYGNPANAMTLSAAGGFWQSPYGGDISTEVPCDLSAAPPTAEYDSWFTIGHTCTFGNATQNASLDLTAFNAGGDVNDNDGAVFVVPGAMQSLAGSSKRVLLAQLTTTQATLPVGFVNVIGRAANSSAEWVANHQQIPSPTLVDCNGNGAHDAFDIALGTALDCDENGVPDSCEYPSAITDCNTNGISDLCDTVSGYSSDVNGNHVPDECECAGDVDGNGYTNVDDLIDVLVAWGDTSYGPADLNQDGIVDSADLVIVLVGWGGCL